MDELSALDYCRLISESMTGVEVTDKSGATLSLVQGTEKAIQVILDAQNCSDKIMLAGNGGSSSVVSHVQNDLAKRLSEWSASSRMISGICSGNTLPI